jgi:hypothetical protein
MHRRARRSAQPLSMSFERDHDDEDQQPEVLVDETRTPAWRFLSRAQTWVSVSLVGFLAILYYVAKEFENRKLDGVLTNVSIVVLVAGSIGAGIWFTRRRHTRAIKKFDLECKSCGYVPHWQEIALTQAMDECQKCHRKLHG